MNAPTVNRCCRLDDHDLTRFSIGCLTTLEQEKVETHLENCPICLSRLEALEGMDEFVQILQRPNTEDEPKTPQSVRDTAKPLALKTSDRYELIETIGTGGMSVVWSANDRLLDREVAIKVLAKDHHTNPERLARFERESRVVARLQHPGIPPIYELARLPDGRPFLAMKRVFGKTLRKERRIHRHPDAVLDVFQQVCRTVAFAHSKGIVHRDLKPDNIMIGQFGDVQVMDWGIAEDVTEGDEGISDKVAGTPAYMSPEQALGLKCGPRSDVYSLGLLLCDMLTGEAFQPASQVTTIRDNEEECRSLFQQIRSTGIDPRLFKIIEGCVQFEPTERHRDASKLCDQIAAFVESRQEDLRNMELEHVRQMAEAAQRRQRYRIASVVGCLILLCAAFGSFAWIRSEARRDRTRGTIRRALTEAKTIRESVRQSNDLQEIQVQAALAAALKAKALAAKSDERELKAQAKDLKAKLETELQDIRRIKLLLSRLEDGLRIESQQTVGQRYQRVVSRRQDAISSGRATAYVFVNTRRGKSSPFRESTTNGRFPKMHVPDEIAADFGILAIAHRSIYRFGEQRRLHYEDAFAEFGLRTADGADKFVKRVVGLKSSVQEKVVSGLRLWFLMSAEFQHADAHVLAETLTEIDRQFQSDADLLRWRYDARRALFDRDASAIQRLCTEAIPHISDHPEELVWGLGCYESLFFKRMEHRFLRLAQRHYLGSYLLSNELADRYSRSKIPNRALPYLTTAVAAKPSRKLKLALARKLLQMQNLDEFYAMRDQCLKEHGNEPSYILEWADAMTMSPVLPPTEKIEMYQLTVDLGFEYPQLPLARIGQIHYDDGDLVSALDYIQRARAVDGLAEDEREELEEAITQIKRELEIWLGAPDEGDQA